MKHRINLAIISILIFQFSACVQVQQISPGIFPYIVTRTPQVRSNIVHTEAVSNTSTNAPALPSPGLEYSATPQPSVTTVDITISPSPSSTSITTPTSTYIPFLGTPIATQLPELEIPTLQINSPAHLGWTGIPTYLGDSNNRFLFRMDYDPSAWAQTRGNFGNIVLANREIPFCLITPISGNELPVEWKVDHQTRLIGSAVYDVNTAILQEAVQFVNYIGGDGNILTGFQVTFEGNPQVCLDQSEAVLASLRSFASVPSSTPSSSPIPRILLSSITPTP